MLKNCVLNVSVNTKKWVKAAVVRAVKTFAQTAVSLITVGNMVTEVNWKVIISISATACIASILTSIAGIPEVESEDE